MRVGVLTGGGDCPGLNAVIRAAGRRVMVDGGVERVLEHFRGAELDALVAIGGEDTLGVAARLYEEHEFPVVGVPKTIDNDLSATDYTFGFDTAVAVATEAIDRLHSTAESHDRVMVCEVMGRHTGWIAVMAGMAGGADVILVPERPVTVERCCELIAKRHAKGKDFSIVVVSEGWELRFESGESRRVESADADQFGHARLGGVGDALAGEIQARTGFETRVTTLGHIQRGGSPTAHDRVLATRYGLKAADLVYDGAWGQMVALRGDRIAAVPIADAVAELKTIPDELYEQASAFFG